MAKKRDYKAEYQRRLSRGKSRGISRTVASGHARKASANSKLPTEIGIKEAKALSKKYDVQVNPSGSVADLAREDMRFVFGRIIKRKRKQFKEDWVEYQLRLAKLQRREGIFDWTNKTRFLHQMKALQLSEREAYSTWFGSPR